MLKNKAPAAKAVKRKKASPDSSVFALKMMQALPDAVLAFPWDGKIAFANEAAEALFGQAAKKLTDLFLSDIIDTTDPVYDAVGEVVRTGKSVSLYDISIREKYAHRITIRPMEEDGLYLMVINLHSVQLRTEWAYTARQALKPAETMARTLAHEIRNPLAGIQAAAQLLAKAPLGPEDKELAGLITRETDRLARLVDKVDVFGDSARERFKEVNIHEVLGQVTQVARAAFGPEVKIEEKYDPSLPNLHGDFDHLVQAQMNLVKNAADALEGRKGRIAIRTFYDNAAAHHPDTHERLPICVEVEDDGHGISQDALRRIFEPYFTTRSRGEGLGLSIVSKIVDDHGGAIDVKSEPGRTVVRLSFPAGGQKK